MLEGLHSAAAGMAAQQERISAVSNDLANASTTGYKHTRVGFRDLLYQQAGRSAAQDGNAQTGTGVAMVDAGRSMAEGALKPTGLPLDVAIRGDGFLRVRLPDGRQALTRDGALHVDGTGRLATSMGGVLQPDIVVPAGVGADGVKIEADGTVTGGGRTLGKLELVTVPAPNMLTPAGDNAYVASVTSGATVPAPATTVLQAGALEASNVDMSQAMVEMIDAQRSYQMASKAIATADQMMEIANGVKR